MAQIVHVLHKCTLQPARNIAGAAGRTLTRHLGLWGLKPFRDIDMAKSTAFWGPGRRQSPAVKYIFSWENQPACILVRHTHTCLKFPSLPLSIPSPQPFDPDVHLLCRNWETSSSWGMLSSRKPQYFSRREKMWICAHSKHGSYTRTSGSWTPSPMFSFLPLCIPLSRNGLPARKQTWNIYQQQGRYRGKGERAWAEGHGSESMSCHPRRQWISYFISYLKRKIPLLDIGNIHVTWLSKDRSLQPYPLHKDFFSFMGNYWAFPLFYLLLYPVWKCTYLQKCI